MQNSFIKNLVCFAFIALLFGCADLPDQPKIDITEPEMIKERMKAVNRHKDAVIYVRLGEDVLNPQRQADNVLPDERVGPYELRRETLAAALQFILDDYDIPIAIQSDLALTRTVTVSRLQGTLEQVVDRVCGLADLYCTYEDDMLTVKETEIFTVALPPIGEEASESFLSGLDAVTGGSATLDTGTNTLVYSITHRQKRNVDKYFERLRNNTALVIYETQIWEVNLSNDNDLGIDWDLFSLQLSTFNLNFERLGELSAAGSGGIQTSGIQFISDELSFDGVVQFLETQGAVKTISQPQITVLSGSTARLRIGNSQSFISEVQSIEGFDSGDDISVQTDVIETGLDIQIGSNWSDSTVYSELSIELQDLLTLDERSVGGTTIQLPETSERTLETTVRIRPGDAMLIGGIVQERDDYSRSGPIGISRFFSTTRSTEASNSELVFMMRPRVVVFTDQPVTGRVRTTEPGAYRVPLEALMSETLEEDGGNFYQPEPLTPEEIDALNGEGSDTPDGLSDYLKNVIEGLI